MKNRKRTLVTLLIVLGYLVCFGAIFYPTVSNLWNQHVNKELEGDYHRAVASLPQEDYSALLAQAQAYNAAHTVNYIKDAFSTDNDYAPEAPYKDYLDPLGNGIMGTLRVPRINVTLAIYHGLGEEALSNGCGHMEGTSLPVGGASTHCVLAAHRGLTGAKLFTDADKLEKGDQFYMEVLNDTYAYEVDRIDVVLPDQTQLLDIVPGQDLVTLLTCTPYGINSHRLLIRGCAQSFVHARRRCGSSCGSGSG